MKNIDNISHVFDVTDSGNADVMTRTQYFSYQEEVDKAIDTFGTFGSAGTLGGTAGSLGTMGCCC